MERLTKRTSVGAANLDYPEKCYCTDRVKGLIAMSAYRQKAFDRLAAYEDTGLEPEEIERILERGTPLENGTAELMKEYLSIGTVDHLRELIQAEKDGRLAVLPCKVGDTIYVIYHGRIVETKVRTFFLGHPSHRVEDRNMKMIRTTDFDISMYEVGKRIFLTREEAEAALKKREGTK